MIVCPEWKVANSKFRMKLWSSSAVIVKPVLRYLGTWLEMLGTAEICTRWTARPKSPWLHHVKGGFITWWSVPPLTRMAMMAAERQVWKISSCGSVGLCLAGVWVGTWLDEGTFLPAGMNELSRTRQQQRCCKAVLSAVGKKFISVCPQKKNFWIQRVTLGITWISSAPGTYLSQWVMSGMRKGFLPTTLLRGLFLWVMCGTLVITALF